MQAIGAPNSYMRRITTLPEPFAPAEHEARTSTPWGTAQWATSYGAGVIHYSTASHGGFHVSPSLLASIPAYLQTADKYADGTAGWFEEDAAWAIVTVCFPELFTLEQRHDAIAVMQRYYSEPWTRFLTEGRF